MIPRAASSVVDGAKARWGLLAIVAGLLVARWMYLAWWCPYGLVEDEAQYWEWAKHPSLSYYTKGPGIAWTIAVTTALLGDTAFAVRAAAPAFAAVMVAAMAWLVVDARARAGSGAAAAWRDGLFAAGALAAGPIMLATALLGTIDGPYCACWALACAGVWRLGHARSAGGRAALAAGVGLAIGVGFLYKYTILLLVPGLLAWRWMSPRETRASWGVVLLGVATAAAAAMPVLVWNQQQGWPTLSHLLGHLGFAEARAGAPAMARSTGGGREWSPWWMPVFVGTQAGLAGPGLFLAAMGVAGAWRERREASRRLEVFLACAGVPILAFYLAVSLVAEPEGNWPMAGYVTLLPLGGLAAARVMSQWREEVAAWRSLPTPRPWRGWLTRRPERAGQVLWHATLGVGVVGGVLMLRADWLGELPGLRGVVPRERLAQGPALAAGVEQLRAAARARLGGGEPLIIAHHYGRASHLAFYLPDRPVVMCASSALGGRPTQHDYWPTHDLRRAEWRGRGALLIGATAAAWGPWFESVEPLGLVPGAERKGVEAFLGRGYRGPGG